jgi:hypothetical protein
MLGQRSLDHLLGAVAEHLVTLEDEPSDGGAFPHQRLPSPAEPGAAQRVEVGEVAAALARADPLVTSLDG